MSQSPTELISAYFDGELSGEEQIQAERILAGSATARQWLAELRAMHSVIESLPLAPLSDSFADAVLGRIAGTISGQEAPLPTTPSQPINDVPASPIRIATVAPAHNNVRIKPTLARRIAIVITLAASLAAVVFLVNQSREPVGPEVVNRDPRRTIESKDSDPSQFPWPVTSDDVAGHTADTIDSSETKPDSRRGYNWAFVCDSISPEAHAQAIKQFEALLLAQHVVLETAATGSNSSNTVANNSDTAQPAAVDRVYVVDATPLQLTDTFKQLEQLVAQQQHSLRVNRGDSPSGGAASNRQLAQSGTTGPSPVLGRSRAVQLPTGPSKPMLAKLPRTASGDAGQPSPSMQRAIFVFRIVPATTVPQGTSPQDAPADSQSSPSK